MRPAARLLVIESELLPDLLAAAPPDAFDRPTVCTGWSVRDVLAHCGAALTGLVEGRIGPFTPEANQVAVDERSLWALDQVLDELFAAYPAAAARIDELDGLVDGLGLGEWIHGGDVREPLGAPDPYASAGIELALDLVTVRSVEREAPALDVLVGGTTLTFGTGTARGSLVTDAETLIRLVSGRRPDPARYDLDASVAPGDLVLFG